MEHEQTNIPEPKAFWTLELLHVALGAHLEIEDRRCSTEYLERLIKELAWFRNPYFARASTLHLSIFMTVCKDAGLNLPFATRRDFSSAAEFVLSLLEKIARREAKQAEELELAANICRELAGVANTYTTYQHLPELQ